MRRDAKPLCESGRFEEAEQKLRDTLDGFEYLLTSTNERTLSVAYELAEFYSQNNRMNDADAVLQWMGEELVKTFGLDHQKTISHMVHVVDLYQQWSRTNDAVTILLRAMDSFHNLPGTGHDPVTTSDQSNNAKGIVNTSEVEETHRTTNFSRIVDVSEGNGQKDADGSLEFQLSIINARTRAKDPETESLILRLIEQGEKLPDQFEGLILKSRGALIDLYLQLGKDEGLELALKFAKERFFTIMKQKKPKSMSLLDAGVDLASMFVKASRFKEADAMFSQVERDLTGTASDDDCDNAIDILIDIGMLYQRYKRWNDARARFEHALALTISSRGAECRLARRLQAALDNRNFSLSSLPSLEHKSSLRRRLMEF
jgi:tetratricopeptide (TPR) repeat protein